MRTCSVCGDPMAEGRTLDYCGKRCRPEARRRGRPAEGPTDTVGAFVDFLGRVERTIASRIGAGQSIAAAWNADRWLRELERDLVDAPELAGYLLEGIRANLRSVTSASDVHGVFSAMLNRVPVLAPALDRAREELDPSPHLVYLLFDRRGALLYVGITDRGPKRLVEHDRTKWWFEQVARVDFERLPSRTDAKIRERLLIDTRRPAYNVQHNGGRRAS